MKEEETMALRSKEYYQKELERVLAEHTAHLEKTLSTMVDETSVPELPRPSTEFAWLAGQLQALVEGILRDAPNWEVTET
jgi:hypothetical protein